MRKRMGSGDPPGLQNRRAAGLPRRWCVRLAHASAKNLMTSSIRINTASVAALAAATMFGVCGCELSLAAESRPRVVHVFVALADNRTQGIVPVAATLGNGE